MKQRRAVLTGVAALVALASACDRDDDATEKKPTPDAAPAKATTARDAAAAGSAGPRADAAPKSVGDGGNDADARSPTAQASADPASSRRFVVDDLADVGPAGPAAATTRGVVLVTKTDDLVLAALGRLSSALAPGPTPVGEVNRPRDDFVALARAPAATRDYAYWITRSRLVRRPVKSGDAQGDLEVLAKDARNDTPVSAPIPEKGQRDVVAYIARAGKDTLVAKIWMEGGHTARLTPDGAGGNSVALVRAKGTLVALSLEGRSGMSPVHARTIRITGGKPELGDDVVPWIGGSAQPMTQLAGVASEAGAVFGLVPLEQDISHFGLAVLGLGKKMTMDAAVSWQTYPNGLDPAPLAVTHACGTPIAVYARPSSSAPRSPQELHLAAITRGGLASSSVLGRSRAFSTVTVAPLPRGLLVAYVADRRTWARTVRCPRG